MEGNERKTDQGIVVDSCEIVRRGVGTARLQRIPSSPVSIDCTTRREGVGTKFSFSILFEEENYEGSHQEEKHVWAVVNRESTSSA